LRWTYKSGGARYRRYYILIPKPLVRALNLWGEQKVTVEFPEGTTVELMLKEYKHSKGTIHYIFLPPALVRALKITKGTKVVVHLDRRELD